MNRTLLDECFRAAGRTTWYESTDQIQADLDTFLSYYNVQRTHQGYRLQGRTPLAALCDALRLDPTVVAPLTIPPENTTDNHRYDEAA